MAIYAPVNSTCVVTPGAVISMVLVLGFPVAVPSWGLVPQAAVGRAPGSGTGYLARYLLDRRGSRNPRIKRHLDFAAGLYAISKRLGAKVLHGRAQASRSVAIQQPFPHSGRLS